MRTLGIATLALAMTAAGCGWNGQKRQPVAVYADVGRPSKEIAPGMLNKACRGFANLATGIVEWPVQTYKGTEGGVSFIKNRGLSRTVGFLKGLLFTGPSHVVGRSGSGAVELATFWAANRPNNQAVGFPLDDEYAWERGVSYDPLKPTFGKGVAPCGWKLAHGLTDGAFGFLEIPGQTVKGVRQKNGPKGIAKGFWYALSRTATGFGEAAFFLFPNPSDTCGRAWTESWPWDGFQAQKAK